jgi:GxxExxY protein
LFRAKGAKFSLRALRGIGTRKHSNLMKISANEVAREIVDGAFRIHCGLGPGLLESVYEVLLTRELEKKGLAVARQAEIPLRYDGLQFSVAFRADLVVEDLVIVEIKSVEGIAPIHRRQLLTYLRLADKQLGLLINFNVVLIRDGICRVVNGLPEEGVVSCKGR